MGYEIDFFPVGEGEKSGDAIALRYGDLYGERGDQTVVVIDGGFKKSGEQIVDHIKKFYRTSYVDIVVSTHPDADHASGLEVVLEELDVWSLWMHRPWKHTKDIANLFVDGRVTDNGVKEKLRRSLENALSLEKLAISKGIPIIEPFEGITDDSRSLIVLGPSEDYYEDLLPHFRGTPEARATTGLFEKAFEGVKKAVRKIAETWDFETLNDEGETSAENNSSVILLLRIDDRSILFTADAGMPALNHAVTLLENASFDFTCLKLIQVPHHGSQRNVGPSILNRLIGPKQGDEIILTNACVSASENGNPKHPSKKVTNAFKRRGAPVSAISGRTICFNINAPDRGWNPVTPLPFYEEVEE